MKVIIVTGTPGTGKTALSKKISKMFNYKYIDVNKLIKENKLHDGYDRKKKCFVVDIRDLNKFLIGEIKRWKSQDKKDRVKGIIIDSHLSHYLPKKYVDLCIVTKCGLKPLKQRLKNKKYSESKVRENLDCEIFDICFNEAKERGHKTKVVDTTKTINIEHIF